MWRWGWQHYSGSVQYLPIAKNVEVCSLDFVQKTFAIELAEQIAIVTAH
jgi:hypothetical protein